MDFTWYQQYSKKVFIERVIFNTGEKKKRTHISHILYFKHKHLNTGIYDDVHTYELHSKLKPMWQNSLTPTIELV